MSDWDLVTTSTIVAISFLIGFLATGQALGACAFALLGLTCAASIPPLVDK